MRKTHLFVGQSLYLGGVAVYEQRMLTEPLIAIVAVSEDFICSYSCNFTPHTSGKINLIVGSRVKVIGEYCHAVSQFTVYLLDHTSFHCIMCLLLYSVCSMSVLMQATKDVYLQQK